MSCTAGDDQAGLAVSLPLDPLAAQDTSWEGRHPSIGLPAPTAQLFPEEAPLGGISAHRC